MSPQDQEVVEFIVTKTLDIVKQQSKDLIDIFAALGPLAIGIAVIIIAILQLRTNIRKLRLDLFEQRFDIYKATAEFIAAIAIDRENTKPEVFERFNKAIGKSYFLFKEPNVFIRLYHNLIIRLYNKLRKRDHIKRDIKSLLENLYRETTKFTSIIRERDALLSELELSEEKKIEYGKKIFDKFEEIMTQAESIRDNFKKHIHLNF